MNIDHFDKILVVRKLENYEGVEKNMFQSVISFLSAARVTSLPIVKMSSLRII